MKTAEEAKREQNELAKHYDLGFWYGTGCEKCCGVYPKFRTSSGFDSYCWYECEVCGKRTKNASMPWIAEKDWNAGLFEQQQMSLF